MRRSFLTLCLASTVLAYPAFAKDIEVNADITKATVYNDRATLTRTAKVEIPAGEHVLVLKGLSMRLDVNSLKADGQAAAKVSFGAVSYKQDTFEDYIVPKEKELNDLLLKLQDERKVYEAEKEALKVGRTFLENLGKQANLREDENIAKLELNPETWGSASEALSLKVSENLKASIAADIKIRDTDNKIKKVRSELQQLRTGQKRSYVVSVPFESDKATTLSFEISYQLPDVGWHPVYDARLDTKTGAMELVQYGSVWQRTGEDWEDVKLTLSTAQPSRGASLPELSPQWVNVYEEGRAMMKASRQSFGMVASNMAAGGAPAASEIDGAYRDAVEDVNEANLERAVSVQSAQINTEGFVGEYNITGPADVKSDGSQSKLLIGAFDVESRTQIQIKPQFDSGHAYLVAMAKLKGDAPILPGQVSLFRDGAFIGKDYLQMLRPGDEADLGFGIDDNITVSRNTLKDERSEVGMITKDNVLERHYVTEIKNLRKTPVEIALFDVIPASRDESVRIEILKDATTPNYETDIKNKKGVTAWNFTLKPQEEVKAKLGWKVSWPKGKNISGL